jgi:pimeloyl-ACP methyl ester carboxylesterase
MMNAISIATRKALGGTSSRRAWRRRFGFGLAVVLVVVTGAVLVAGAVAKARLQAAHPPVGQLVDIGGYRLHLACEGSGSPTVILEAGAGNVGLHWALVQPEVAAQTRVCVYDRAGMGWSDSSPRPRTPAVMAEELATLLDRGGVKGPYVLAAHSLGGVIARQFALAYPQDVAGMVLVDSASEQQLGRFPEPIRKGGSGQLLPLRLMHLAANIGILALNPAILPPPAQLPADTAATVQALVAASGKMIGAFQAELATVNADTTPPVASLGDIPLLVLRHGRGDLPVQGAVTAEVVQEYEATWAQMQDELAGLSPRGRVIVAEGSGHDIHLERPDLVIDAIAESCRHGPCPIRPGRGS